MKRKQLLKGIFDFLAYTLAGLTGCALAFFISLQFLTPVFSDPDSPKPALEPVNSKKEKGIIDTFNAVAKDVKTATRILKDIMLDTFGKKEKKKDSSPDLKAPRETIPLPPEELEGFETARPEPFVPSDKDDKGPAEGPREVTPPAEEDVGESVPPESSPSPPVPPVSPEEGPREVTPPTGNDTDESVPPESSSSPPAPPVSKEEDQPQGSSLMSGSLLQLKSYMEPFIYDPSSRRRNPFEDVTQKREKTRIIRTPLERYSLKDIRLKGIIWGVKSPKALFQLPDQKGFYTLLQGERLGKYGVIQEIREDEVEIQETIVKGDGQGQQTETRKTIKRIDRLKY